MRRGITWAAVLGLYLLSSIFVSFIWFHYAQTEVPDKNRFNSVIELADGTAPLPFVRRRLIADAARALSSVLPPPSSHIYDTAIAWDVAAGQRMAVLRIPISYGWPRERLPLLLATFLLHALAVTGFGLTCRAIIKHFYETPEWLANVLGVCFGVALLGSCVDIHYPFYYVYDYPHAFIFALGLLLIFKRSLWLLPVFAAAASSKETAILLILAVLVVGRTNRDWGMKWWVLPVLMTVIYAGVRTWIAFEYTGFVVADFWWPGRNLSWLRNTALLFSWTIAFLFIAVVRLVQVRHRLPRTLVLLASVFIPVLVSIAFFKGFIEELRQYGELLPVIGPLVVQHVFHELGFGSLLRVRPSLLGTEPTLV